MVDERLTRNGEKVFRHVLVTSEQSLLWVRYHAQPQVGEAEGGAKEQAGEPLVTHLLLTCIEELSDLAMGGGVLLVEAVGLLSPPALNGTGDWKLEPLAEIRIPRRSDYGRVFVLRSGESYAEPDHAGEDDFELVQYQIIGIHPEEVAKNRH